MPLRVFWFVLWSIGATAMAQAEPVVREDTASVPGPVLSLPVVEITAPRPNSGSLLRVSPGFAQGYDVAGAHGRSLMVGDLLEGAVGLHIRQFGGVGSFAAASIRGSSPAQVAVYLDGVPLNQAQYGVVNLADLPLEALDRVEVFRGAAPLSLESSGGGAINLISTEARGQWVRASVGSGSFGTWRWDAAGGWQGGRHALLFVGQILESRGDYGYLDDNATPFNRTDDEVTTRQNNWVRLMGVTGRASSTFGPLQLSVVHDHLSKRQGVPGIGANQVLASRLDTWRDVSSLLISPLLKRGQDDADDDYLPASSIRLFRSWYRDAFSDPQGKLTGVRQESDNRTVRFGATSTFAHRVVGGQYVTLVGEASDEAYRPHLVLPRPRDFPQSRRTVFTWGLEDRLSVRVLPVILIGSWKRTETLDRFPAGPAYPGAFLSPAISRSLVLDRPVLSISIGLLPGVALKSSAARLTRTPTLEELFGNRAGVYGNPAARPERVETRDIGLVGQRSSMSAQALPSTIEIQASAYRSDAKDLLVYIQNSQRSVVAMNISAARLWGMEWDGCLAWSSGLTVNSSWTRQWTRDEGEVVYWHGRELPSRPRDESALQIALSKRHWRAFYDLHYVSANWLDRYNSDRVEARIIHDLGAGIRYPSTSIELTAECRNLGNRQVEDFAGYPLPGRTYYIGLTTQIRRKENTP